MRRDFFVGFGPLPALISVARRGAVLGITDANHRGRYGQ